MKKFQYYGYEIRIRIFSFVLSLLLVFLSIYSYGTEYIWFIIKCLVTREQSEDNLISKLSFQCTEISEAFQSYIYISILGVFFFTLPLGCYHIFTFVAPGLFKKENVYWKSHIRCLLFLFYFSVYIGITEILNFGWTFFSQFEIKTIILNVEFEPRLLKTLHFVFSFMSFFVFICQFPYFFYLCLQTNKIYSEYLTTNRLYFYFSSILICSLLAPPDIVFQSLLILLSFVFIEFFIFFSIFLKTKKLYVNQRSTLHKNRECVGKRAYSSVG